MARATLSALALAKGIPPNLLAKFATEDERGVIFAYKDLDGTPARSHVRHNLESAQPSSWAQDGNNIVAFGSHLVKHWRERGVFAMTITEGDTDTLTAWLCKLPAIGMPGATMHKLVTPEHVESFAEVHLAFDNDTAGERSVTQTAKHLRDGGYMGKIRRLSPTPYKDLTEWRLARNGDFDDELRARIAEAPEVPVAAAPGVDGSTASRKRPSDPLAFTSILDLLSEPEEQVAFVVDNLLPSGGISMLVAKPKVGKSTIARTLALCVDHGEDFLGRKCARGAVAWLALEEKRTELARQFRELGANGQESIQFFCGQAPADMIDRLRDYMRGNPVALIVVDPLIRLTKSRDLNDYALVSAELEPITILARESGAHLILLHHSPKAGDAVLGSTALFANVDTLLEVRKSPEGRRTVCSTQRYGVDLEETVIERDPDTGFIRAVGTRKEADDQDARRLILTFLGTCTEMVEEPVIRENVEARRSDLVVALRGLVKDRQIQRSGEGKRGSPYTYGTLDFVSGSGSSTKAWEPEIPETEMTEKARQIEVYSGSGLSSQIASGGTSIQELGTTFSAVDLPEPITESIDL